MWRKPLPQQRSLLRNVNNPALRQEGIFLSQEPITIYDRIGGYPTISRIVEAFYPRVQRDPLLAPIFPDDIRPVMEKQRLFLTQFFGGPPL
ncbi:hypothetical protein EMG21_33750, partial [Klebsiella pneumoniae]